MTAHAQVAGSVPAFIDIPVIGTHAQVVPLGEEDDGSMQVPTDPDTVGWYDLGTGVGAQGNALFDGHVDWGGRLRVFGLLRQLEPGDAIQITDTAGNVLSYRVTWVKLYDADTAPLDQIFEQTTDEEVSLITCGGAFDQSVHTYVSRWVVRAPAATLTQTDRRQRTDGYFERRVADELAQPFFVEVLRLDDLGQTGQTDQREVTADASHRARNGEREPYSLWPRR